MSREDLPHIIPGQPRRSMYGEHNTHDEAAALTAAAFQFLADHGNFSVRRGGLSFDLDREPIHVVAEVGRRIEP